jgi:Rieske Fe-S protein
MAQNDVVAVEVHFLLLCLLVEISLRIPWACTHLAGPLDEGTVEDGVVQCPWHGSRFCMRDGSVVTGPAVYAAPTFAARLRNGKVELRRLGHA